MVYRVRCYDEKQMLLKDMKHQLASIATVSLNMNTQILKKIPTRNPGFHGTADDDGFLYIECKASSQCNFNFVNQEIFSRKCYICEESVFGIL